MTIDKIAEPSQPLSGLARRFEPVCTARIKHAPEDFIVKERLGFDPSPHEKGDANEHHWLYVRKRGMNTQEVARALATRFGCQPREVGFSGLKDKQALTEQWFSLPPSVRMPETSEHPEFQVLRSLRQPRKLRRGVHKSNQFELVLRGVEGTREAIMARLAELSERGFPNYFGAQRFGYQGRNLQRVERWFAHGETPPGSMRALVLSAARSHLFNLCVSAKVSDGSWSRIEAGDVMMLNGSNSLFQAHARELEDKTAAAQLLHRLAVGDIHHSSLLAGAGMSGLFLPNTVERDVFDAAHKWVSALERKQVKAARRAVRVIPQALDSKWLDATSLRLSFELPRGAFATALLRELGRIPT